MISGRMIVEKMEVTVGGTRIEFKRAIKYLGVIIDDRLNFKGVREVHRQKGMYNTRSTGEDDTKCWRTRSIQKEWPNMVGGTLRGNDKVNTVLGVPSKCDQMD